MSDFAPDRKSGHDGRTDTELDARDVRALTERMSVLDDVGPARGADGIFRVVSQSGSTYTVDLQLGACSCPDSERRNPDGGCKHVRRAAFATGERGVNVVPERVGRHDVLHEVLLRRPAVVAGVVTRSRDGCRRVGTVNVARSGGAVRASIGVGISRIDGVEHVRRPRTNWRYARRSLCKIF
jgi:hypothetical protein